MKKIYFGIFIIAYAILVTTRTANAQRNEKLFEDYKKALKQEEDIIGYTSKAKFLYDKTGNLYMGYSTSNQLALVDAPSPQKGETTLLIPDTVEIDGKLYLVTSVGHDTNDRYGEQIFFPGRGYKTIIYGKNVVSLAPEAHRDNPTWEEVEFLSKTMVIGNCSFADCERLKTVYGSENIIKIEGAGFSNTAIETLSLSKKCKEIGAGAFLECTKLKEIPDISGISIIKDSTFAMCNSLKEVIIPWGIKEIDKYAFLSCINLRQVYMPASIKRIGHGVFSYCIRLNGNVTIDKKNKYLTAKDNMILNKKANCMISIITEKKVMVLPSYVKSIGGNWWYGDNVGCWGNNWWNKKNPKDVMRILIIQNKDIKFLEKSMPSKCYRHSKLKILYPDSRKKFVIKKKQIERDGRNIKGNQWTQRPYTLYPAPARVKAKLKKGKVQVSFKKLKKSAVKKYKITYRIKKNGRYQAQKEKVIKGKRAMLCSLKKGESCEVRVSAYTKQSGVWVPGKFSRMVKVRRK